MQKALDPVCGMTVDPQEAAGQTTKDGRTYYFCSTDCKEKFDANPAQYLSADSGGASERGDKEVNPPYTKTGGMVSPKFGSAVSGGAESEPLPPGARD